jgi:O-methyltransferase
MMAVDRERRPFVYQSDYIRASALELAANEIYDQNIPGNAAELGVYRGDFAKLINEAFPDRILYLWVSLKTRLVFRDTLQFSA